MKPGKLLQGVVVPTVTPLTKDGGLDEAALRLLLDRVIEGGVTAIFALGTTGEGPALSLAVRRRAVEVTCEAVAGRVPVVVAAIETSVDEVLQTGVHAAQAGADALAIAPPFYLALSQADIVRFGRIVNDRSQLPAYLYNVPYGHLPQFSLTCLEQLSRCPRLLGLKDSSGNFEQLRHAIEIFSDRPECSVLVGPESLLASALRAGADGGVSGGANVFPRLYAQLFHAHEAGDQPLLDRLQQRVLDVQRHFYGLGEPESGLVRGLKTALEAQGIGAAVMAAPYLPPTAKEFDDVRRTLLDWKDVAVTGMSAVIQ